MFGSEGKAFFEGQYSGLTFASRAQNEQRKSRGTAGCGIISTKLIHS